MKFSRKLTTYNILIRLTPRPMPRQSSTLVRCVCVAAAFVLCPFRGAAVILVITPKWGGCLKSKRPLEGGWEAVEREMEGRRKEDGRWLLGWGAMGLCRGWKRARAPVECVPPMPVGRWVCRVFILGRPGRVPRA